MSESALLTVAGYSAVPPHLPPLPDLEPANGSASVATVVTFFPHPREFFSGQRQPLLSPIAEKALMLKQAGIQQLVLLPFNPVLAQLSPAAFVEQVLVHRLQPQRISVGEDFRFGHRREGTAADLAAIAAHHNIPVTIVPLRYDQGERVSSSRVRHALSQGDLATAQRLLGRPYCLTGRVVKGEQVGRTIGFPTANLKLPSDKFVPCQGVYSVQVHGVSDLPQPGVLNIGTRPTVNGRQQTVEVHLLNWSGNLYGQTLTLSLSHFLRPEQKFDSLDQLKQQIQADCDAAQALPL